MSEPSTSHYFVGDDEYKLFRPEEDEIREATISLASRVRDAYPDAPSNERVEIFRDLAGYLALPTSEERLRPIKQLLAARA